MACTVTQASGLGISYNLSADLLTIKWQSSSLSGIGPGTANNMSVELFRSTSGSGSMFLNAYCQNVTIPCGSHNYVTQQVVSGIKSTYGVGNFSVLAYFFTGTCASPVANLAHQSLSFST